MLRSVLRLRHAITVSCVLLMLISLSLTMLSRTALAQSPSVTINSTQGSVLGNHTIKATDKTSGRSALANSLTSANWAQFGFLPEGGRYNNHENTIKVSNVYGTLYIGSADKHVYALNPQTGTQIWAAPTSDWVISSPAVANGVVYANTYDGKLEAFNAQTGTQVWSMSVGSIAYSAPAVANGVVYVTSNDGHLYALNAQTGAQLLTTATSVNDTTSPTIANGIVYFGSNDHNLYSFHLPGH